MGIDVRAAGFGQPAVAALTDLLSELRGGDPLAPATVLVPTNHVGVATRRALARASERGLAGVTFSTIYRLAELLGATRLAASGRRPVSTPDLAAAVRTIVGADPGVFSRTHEHPATEKALLVAHRDLSDLDHTRLDLLARQSPRAADVVRIHRAIQSKLEADWYDEQDLLGAAEAAIDDAAPVLSGVGPVIVHLPRRFSAAQRSFLGKLGASRQLTLLMGITGDEEVDSVSISEAQALLAAERSPELEATVNRAVPTPGARVVSVSDADDEVRAVVRAVVDAARAGGTLDRMAVLYGSEQPYARLLQEQLSSAGVAFNGMALGSLADSVTGRTLVALLDLRMADYHRADLLAFLSSAPIRHGGRLAPVSAWERVSRSAGVVRGAAQWDKRLTVLLTDLHADLESVQADPELIWRADGIEREISRVESLWTFVAQLILELERSQASWSWSRRCGWLRTMLTRYLGGETIRASWPEHEQEAAERIDGILDRLAGLDPIEADPTPEVFARTLQLELDGSAVRQGRFGDGLLVGGLHMGIGLDLDRVWVLGMAEGLLPSRPRDDSLLPDRERQVTGGALRTRAVRLLEQRRDYLAALATASQGATLMFPRGDLRRSNEYMPSRWLLEAASAHEGRQIFTPDLADLGECEWFTEVPSQVAGLLSTSHPPTRHEYDVVSVLGAQRSGSALESSFLAVADSGFSRGLELIDSRASRQFTRFDGNLSGLDLPSPAAAGQIMSPTRLEAWSVCPHAYLMRYLLGVEPVDVPEAVYSLGALERGSLVHDALDIWLSEVIATEDSGAPWTTEHRQRLRAIGELECRRLQDRGLVGGTVRWRYDRRAILADLDELISRDNERRAAHGLRAVASELGFGLRGSESGPLEWALSDGQTLRFRGSADRVEVDADGAIVVIDYKTGSDNPYRSLSESDPDLSGTKLQLPVYAAAARRHLGRPEAAVRAAYWFITTKRSFKMVELPLSPVVTERIDEVLREIVAGIAGGIFPQHPEPEKFSVYTACRYCDPDELGTRERRREWERKLAAPELRPYLRLADPVRAAALAEAEEAGQ
jgi:ATP-dependent helicase/nuclease subunit B